MKPLKNKPYTFCEMLPLIIESVDNVFQCKTGFWLRVDNGVFQTYAMATDKWLNCMLSFREINSEWEYLGKVK